MMLDALLLICDGVANTPTSTTTSASVYGPNGLSTGRATTTGTEQANERFTVEVSGDRVRVRVPKSFIPGIHSGGDSGWWNLDGTSITDSEISGRFRFNMFNKPTITISRMTGYMEVVNSYDYHFRGTCVRSTQQQPIF